MNATNDVRVEPLRRPAAPVDSAPLEQTIARKSEASCERCNVGKGRRFVVTATSGAAASCIR